MFDKRIDFALKDRDDQMAAFFTAEKAYWLYVGRKDKAEALKMIEHTLPLGKIKVRYFYDWLVLLLTEIGEFDSAKVAVELARGAGWKQIYEAKTHEARKEWEPAIQNYKKILEWVEVQYQALYKFLVARCYHEKGDSDNAIQELKSAQAIYSNSIGIRAVTYPKGFYLLGRIHERKGDREAARNNYEKFLSLWKDADKDLPDLVDVKARLAKLKGMVKQ
jgi:tetratricopeptide (TPR) repeat protein